MQTFTPPALTRSLLSAGDWAIGGGQGALVSGLARAFAGWLGIQLSVAQLHWVAGVTLHDLRLVAPPASHEQAAGQLDARSITVSQDSSIGAACGVCELAADPRARAGLAGLAAASADSLAIFLSTAAAVTAALVGFALESRLLMFAFSLLYPSCTS